MTNEEMVKVIKEEIKGLRDELKGDIGGLRD